MSEESVLKAPPKEFLLALEGRWNDFVPALDPVIAGKKDTFVALWAASPFVMNYCLRNPASAARLVQDPALYTNKTVAQYRNELAVLCSVEDSVTALQSKLRAYRYYEMVRVAWRDLMGHATTAEILHELSNFADATMQSVLDYATRQLNMRYGVPVDQKNRAQQIVVFALGKLGGRELNFSSDIDLVFAFPQSGETNGKHPISNSEFFTHLIQLLIKLLDEVTNDGFVFRIDLRLRPFGDSGPLITDFDALEDYLQSHGREWERYAWIKARVIAGDIDAGHAILATLKPFVYRKYLDFGVFEALREMKNLIDDKARAKQNATNIKIGVGGIREIEFIAQAFQLVHGGRIPDMQTNEITRAMKQIADHGWLSNEDVTCLMEAYWFLRKLENRLQMVGDTQTHILPTSSTEQARIAFVHAYPDWAGLLKAYNQHTQTVQQKFTQLFLQQVSTETVAINEHKELASLWVNSVSGEAGIHILRKLGVENSEACYQRIQHFRDATWRKQISARARQRLDQFLPLLLLETIKYPQPERVLQRIFPLLTNIARRSSYLALMLENQAAIPHLVKLFDASEWIAQQIAQHPILLDELLDPRALYHPSPQDLLRQQLKQDIKHENAFNLESFMECLRRFKHSQVLRVAASDILGELPTMKVSDHLTWIAEVSIEAAYEYVEKEMLGKFGRNAQQTNLLPDKLPFAIIAYGKFGGIELGYGSDLDLVFLHNCDEHQEQSTGNVLNTVFFTRLAQRLVHILTSYTPTGLLYEVDVRLRPEGESGPLVAHVDAFRDYQLHHAWPWEHQALVRARCVLGNAQLRAQFAAIREQVLCLPRKAHELKEQVRTMREKMLVENSNKNPMLFDIKKDRGGLTDIEFMVQYLVLCNAKQVSSLCKYPDNVRILEQLAARHIITSDAAHQLKDIYIRYRDEIHKLSLQAQTSIVSAELFAVERATIQTLWDQLIDENQLAAK